MSACLVDDFIDGSVSVGSAHHFSNFADVWQQAGFGQSLTASTIITLATVVISVAVSVPAGFAFATMRFRGPSPHPCNSP